MRRLARGEAGRVRGVDGRGPRTGPAPARRLHGAHEVLAPGGADGQAPVRRARASTSAPPSCRSAATMRAAEASASCSRRCWASTSCTRGRCSAPRGHDSQAWSTHEEQAEDQGPGRRGVALRLPVDFGGRRHRIAARGFRAGCLDRDDQGHDQGRPDHRLQAARPRRPGDDGCLDDEQPRQLLQRAAAGIERRGAVRGVDERQHVDGHVARRRRVRHPRLPDAQRGPPT